MKLSTFACLLVTFALTVPGSAQSTGSRSWIGSRLPSITAAAPAEWTAPAQPSAPPARATILVATSFG